MLNFEKNYVKQNFKYFYVFIFYQAVIQYKILENILMFLYQLIYKIYLYTLKKLH